MSSARSDRLWIALEALVALGVVVAVIGRSYGPAATLGFILVGTMLTATVYFISRMISAPFDPGLDAPGRTLDEARIALEAEKSILLSGIKEFEADAGVGKVDRADYDALRKAAEQRAVEIIRVLKEEDARWLREAEGLVAARTGKAPPPADEPTGFTVVEGGLRCDHCGRVSDADSRFCTGCGRRKAA